VTGKNTAYRHSTEVDRPGNKRRWWMEDITQYED